MSNFYFYIENLNTSSSTDKVTLVAAHADKGYFVFSAFSMARKIMLTLCV